MKRGAIGRRGVGEEIGGKDGGGVMKKDRIRK